MDNIEIEMSLEDSSDDDFAQLINQAQEQQDDHNNECNECI